LLAEIYNALSLKGAQFYYGFRIRIQRSRDGAANILLAQYIARYVELENSISHKEFSRTVYPRESLFRP